MSKKITLVVLLSVMLIATVLTVWDVAALSAMGMSELSDLPCKYISEYPCPTTYDCGYRFDGACCVAQCPKKPFCFIRICQGVPSLRP